MEWGEYCSEAKMTLIPRSGLAPPFPTDQQHREDLLPNMAIPSFSSLSCPPLAGLPVIICTPIQGIGKDISFISLKADPYRNWQSEGRGLAQYHPLRRH